ncbi:28S ribosomal protein S6, mitochondrial [Suricata suricatta]|uniref:28S ribosomal protein S6, mitochondrial n=1 Tax=Suricata suricatta TaxID=37032 RepID=UPI0011552C69|nr:28S ribosomal protein S6, mitochondrial [Suricata suricatta]
MESSSWFENRSEHPAPGVLSPVSFIQVVAFFAPSGRNVSPPAFDCSCGRGFQVWRDAKRSCSRFIASDGVAEDRAPRPGGSSSSSVLGQPETAAALKRTLEALMDRGAVVRNLENLGDRALPYKISAHSQRHSRGGYFLVDFYAPTTAVESIMEHLSRDIDVIRPNVVKHPLTQEVKACEGIVPVPLEEKLYSTKKRK